MAHDNPEYHHNLVLVAVAEKLGLDPARLIDLEVTADGTDDVLIKWSGVDTMALADFNAILEVNKA